MATKTHVASDENLSRVAAALEAMNLDETQLTELAGRVAELEGIYKNNALATVGQYPSRDLTEVLADEIETSGDVYSALHVRNVNNDYSGLMVGDYMDVPLSGYSAVTSQSSIRFVLAHVNPYYNCGDTAMGRHMAFVADSPVPVSSSATGVANSSYLMWNTTSTNNGTSSEASPYLCSNLKAWETLLAACLPSELTSVLLNPRFITESRYSSSGTLTAPSGWAWKSLGKVFSPSEVEVWGAARWSASGYAGGIGRAWDLFAHGENKACARGDWWLRSVTSGSSSYVCSVIGSGYATYHAATHAWGRPRPCFLLG